MDEPDPKTKLELLHEEAHRDLTATMKSRSAQKGVVTAGRRQHENALLDPTDGMTIKTAFSQDDLRVITKAISKVKVAVRKYQQLSDTAEKIMASLDHDDLEDFSEQSADYIADQEEWIEFAEGNHETRKRQFGPAQDPLPMPVDPAPPQPQNVIVQLPPGFNRKSELEPLTIKTFTGDHKEWVSFFDNFQASVDSDPDFTDAKKLKYLFQYVEGEALNVIKGLEITNANYKNAMRDLKEQYANPRRIANSHLKALFEYPDIQDNAAAMQGLINAFRHHVRCIEQQGVKVEHWDLILIFMMTSKLPQKLRKQWNIHAAGKGFLKKKYLDDWLTKQTLGSETTDQLESQTTIKTSTVADSKSSNKGQTTTKTVNVATTKDSSDDCKVCGDGNHRLFQCPVFKKKTVEQRRGIVKSKNYCYNCLSSDHMIPDCTSKSTCREGNCGKRHHTLVHIQFKPKTGGGKSTTAKGDGETEKTVSVNVALAKPNNGLTPEPVLDCSNESGTTVSSTKTKDQHEQSSSGEQSLTTPQDQPQVDEKTVISAMGSTSNTPSADMESILPTVQVTLYDKSNQPLIVRGLLDTGSQLNFVSESLFQALGKTRERSKININPIGPSAKLNSNGTTTLKVGFPKCKWREPLVINAQILKVVQKDPHPSGPINVSAYQKVKTLLLADETFHVPQEIELVLGNDFFNDILVGGAVLKDKSLTMYKSSFGYLVSGPAEVMVEQSPPRGNAHSFSVNLATTSTPPFGIDSFPVDITRFWEVEELPQIQCRTKNHDDPRGVTTVLDDLSPDDQQAVRHYNETHRVQDDGRIVVKLPFRNSERPGLNYHQAVTRFVNQEQSKLTKNPELYDKYREFVQEFIDLGHLEPVPDEEVFKPAGQVYYLCHHAVLKESSTTTKLRVVFDGSAVTSNGKSLNDCLLKGPKIQDDLFHHLIRFRFHRIALSADITKMYRQIALDTPDRDFHRLIWRSHPNESTKVYRMTRVTYGVSSSSYHSIRALRDAGDSITLSTTSSSVEPNSISAKAGEIVKRDFYVDDFLGGASTTAEAEELCRTLRIELEKRQFQLRKWSSSDHNIISALPESLRENADAFTFQDPDHKIKTLGIQWKPLDDAFIFVIAHVETEIPEDRLTKRILLSDISKTFDPVGWLSPVTIQLKMLMQTSWINGIGWDQTMPREIADQFLEFRRQLVLLRKIAIPRCVLPVGQIDSIELHVFCDASTAAYAAAVYVRIVTPQEVKVSLLTSKSKVAPTKTLSVPRLELSGVLLGAKLVKAVESSLLSMDIIPSQICGWTDSTIALCWINSESRNYNVFVANRISQIQRLLPVAIWRHVGTKDNPADLPSRGIPPADIIDNLLWFHGPKWLEKMQVPDQPDFTSCTEERKKDTFCNLAVIKSTKQQDHEFLPVSNFSSFTKLLRLVQVIFQFLSKFTKFKNIFGVQANQKDETENQQLPCETKSIAPFRRSALLFLVRREQEQYFPTELKLLRAGKATTSSSRVSSLYPMLEEGVLKVGGRLWHAEQLSDDFRTPMLLPHESPLAWIICQDIHARCFHGGLQMCLSQLRTQFWITNAKTLLRKLIRHCVTCHRYNSKPQTQLMADLPQSRVTPTEPFAFTGLDFAGPYTIRCGSKNEKAYFCIFICFCTKAVHLESVLRLDSESCSAALRRFVARRGAPERFYSDNGKNFIGARSEIQKLSEVLSKSSNRESLANVALDLGASWNMIPPGSPHFGGLWESGVKLTKSHLKKIVGKNVLSQEEFTTILTEIESILNSRPLVAATDDPNDLRCITPAMLVTGKKVQYMPTRRRNLLNPQMPSMGISVKEVKLRWKHCRAALAIFWKRWSKEYLTSLQPRQKWAQEKENFQVNDIILLTDENSAPLYWPLGRITKVFTGNDDLVRTVKVRTQHGTYIRPIAKLRRLPFHNTCFEAEKPQGGE